MSNPRTDADLPAITNTFYGSRLFIKFFLWVWIALVLTGFFVAIYGYFYHVKPEKQRMFQMGQEMIEENGQMMVDAYEKLGKEEAASFKLPGVFWLYDSNLNLLLSSGQIKFKTRFGSSKKGRMHWYSEKFKNFYKDNSEKFSEFAGKLLAEKAAESIEIADEVLIGSLIISDAGHKYAIISHIPSKFPNQSQFLFDRLIENLPLFLLATGLLCLWLARYMVKPLVELRAASRKFAQGNFTVRISGESAQRFDEIGDLALDFNEMAEKIENLISSQRRLFSDISHELRSPLARLQVSLEILQKKVSTAEQPMLARIEKEIARMNALIEEVLQFSKLESGNLNGNVETIELRKLLTDICSDAGFEGRSRNCKVNLSAEEEIRINGVSQLIERAIENLLRNAIKFSPETATVAVALTVKEGSASITIADQGPGIPESDLQKVFAPFYCMSEARNPQKGGIGLGLAIAHRAISLHQGRIELKNRPEGGLVATITLPTS